MAFEMWEEALKNKTLTHITQLKSKEYEDLRVEF